MEPKLMDISAIFGLEEAISDLHFIRTATKDAQIAALAGSAAAVAELYLKQAKGGTK
jgi:hypothetical protein